MSDNVIDLAEYRRRLPKPYEKWSNLYIRDGLGRVIHNVANVAVALRCAPELANTFWYDEMLREPVLRLPGQPPRRIENTDISLVQEWLQHSGMPKIGRDHISQAIVHRASERPFHPVREFVRSLKWDQKPRLDTWLSDHCGVEHSAYTARVGRTLMTAMVARVLKGGCKVDHLFVLDGGSGVCRILAGECFSDSLPRVLSRDASQHLRGKWVVAIGAGGKQSAASLKRFMAQRVDEYRPAYARRTVTEPRQCVFVCTSGRLKDETPWSVKVGKIDLKALAGDRDQLFAEAVAAFPPLNPGREPL